MNERHHLRGCERTELPEEISHHLLRPRRAHGGNAHPPTKRERVPRNVQLRHDGDPALGGVRDNLLELLLRIISPLLTQKGFGALKARIFLRFETPPLIFGKMPVEKIHLVKRHHVENRLDALDLKEVTSAIVHEPAPAEGRPVHNAATRNAAAPKLLQLVERRPRMAFAAAVGGRHRHAA